MPKRRPRWPVAVAFTAGGAALGIVGSQLFRQQSTAVVATLADALMRQALLNGPIVATGLSAAAGIAASALVPAVVVYALCKWGK